MDRRIGILTGLAVAVLFAACGESQGPTGAPAASAGAAPTAAQPETATPGPAASQPASSLALINQPDPPAGIDIAPEPARVDLAMPTFSRPTDVTNALFPVSSQASVLLVGEVDGQPFRTEVTLLPETRVIVWEGQTVETLVSQYVAYLDGRIHEVAYDFYAQADDGSVWYFGEDVFNFEDGAIADTHGTWIAGRDGPAAMIMPARPRVGDVYRPENIPGLVFEEVTVKGVNERLDGPLGPIDGGLLITELHMDGGVEDKIFAPGYGEFFTGSGGDVEALALAVPTDATSNALPAELTTLTEAARLAIEAGRAEDWPRAMASAGSSASAWRTVVAGDVPRLLDPIADDAVATLVGAVDARDASATTQAAIGLARWSLDLQLRYRLPFEIDLARFDLWAAQLVVDAGADDAGSVSGDVFSLDYVRDRIVASLSPADAARLNGLLEDLHVTMGDHDLAAAAAVAAELRQLVLEVRPAR